jgi:DNA-binding LacI/PurR family transcriptional regulator
VRQADVARAAGVSQATVSLVLSKSGDLSIGAETRQAVLDAARTLGYAPDPIAQRLASGRNSLIGLHTFSPRFPTNLTDSYYPYLEGVEEEAAAQAFDLLLFTGAAGSTSRESAIHRLRLADGCVLVGRHPVMNDIQSLLDEGYPLVYIGHHDELGGSLAYVGADYAHATEDLIDHLWGLGHRRIVYIQDTDTAIASLDRERGFDHAVERLGVQAVPLRITHTNITTALVRRWAEDGYTAIIVEGTDSFDALVATMRALRELGLEVPRDMSVAMTGSDPNPYLDADRPVVTGFRTPRQEMGRQALRLLVEMLSGEDLPMERRQRLLQCSLLEGTTAGPPRR